MKPRAGGLFQAIERLTEETNMVQVRVVDETGWLCTIDCLLELPMEKCVLDIKLMYRPRTRGGEAENHTDRGGFTTGLKVSS